MVSANLPNSQTKKRNLLLGFSRLVGWTFVQPWILKGMPCWRTHGGSYVSKVAVENFYLRILKCVTCLDFFQYWRILQSLNFCCFFWKFWNNNPLCCTYQNHRMALTNVFDFLLNVWTSQKSCFLSKIWGVSVRDLVMWSEDQWEALKKIAWEGDTQTNRQTLWLLDQLGPKGRVGENVYYLILWKKYFGY